VFLDQAIVLTDTAISDLAAAGPSPVAGGDEFVRKMTGNLNTVKTFFGEAKAGVDDFDPKNPASLIDVLGDGPEGLEDLETPGNALRASPELAAAAEQAPKCKELTST
jgi:hypothetical protein